MGQSLLNEIASDAIILSDLTATLTTVCTLHYIVNFCMSYCVTI